MLRLLNYSTAQVGNFYATQATFNKFKFKLIKFIKGSSKYYLEIYNKNKKNFSWYLFLLHNEQR